MFRIFVASMCFVSMSYAGLKEDIEKNFNKCMSASDYKDTYSMGYTGKETCFNEFSNKYANALYKQCENGNKDECMKLFHALHSSKGYTGFTQNKYEFTKLALDRFALICKGNECYEGAKIIGIEDKRVLPLLEKGCRENSEDACYAIGK